jgi:guanylate kinase
MKGPLIIVSGPSGCGKSTVLDRLRRTTDLPLHLAVSATTRAPRRGELNGKNYYFWTRERFEEEQKAEAFLEWANVYGNCYGTLRSEVEPFRAHGTGVILEIDVQGAASVRRLCPDNVSIFLKAPSPEVYRQRLEKRHTEDEATIQRRLAKALEEEAQSASYNYVIVNGDLEPTVAELQAIIRRSFAR